MTALTFLFGAIVGLSLGLTGGGGAIFAVPLLVYGLTIPTKEAVGISLAAVGATSVVGFLHRWRQGEVDLRAGLVLAVAGAPGAPLGTWLAELIPDALLLLLFAGLMVIVAVRLWQQASRSQAGAEARRTSPRDAPAESTCRCDAAGTLNLDARCGAFLVGVGLFTGVLSGMLGVGGGFVIVPALVLFGGMPMPVAVGTSLMVIALVSASGVAFQILGGRTISADVTALFVVGGVAGLFVGMAIGRRLPESVLQRVFAVAILAVAVFVVVRNLGA
jgi:hypothetical protein